MTDPMYPTESAEIAELAAAMSGMQGKLHAVQANMEVAYDGVVRFVYADLASLINSCREPLQENGLCVTQCYESRLKSVGDGYSTYLVTKIMHTSGQWKESALPIPTLTDKDGPKKIQDFGSLTTYMRRYSFGALLGLATEKDTDGGPDEEEGKKEVSYRKPSKPVDKNQPLTAEEKARKATMEATIDAHGADLDVIWLTKTEEWVTSDDCKLPAHDQKLLASRASNAATRCRKVDSAVAAETLCVQITAAGDKIDAVKIGDIRSLALALDLPEKERKKVEGHADDLLAQLAELEQPKEETSSGKEEES